MLVLHKHYSIPILAFRGETTAPGISCCVILAAGHASQCGSHLHTAFVMDILRDAFEYTITYDLTHLIPGRVNPRLMKKVYDLILF